MSSGKDERVDQDTFPLLLKRMGKTHMGKRLALQALHSAVKLGAKGLHVYWENFGQLAPILRMILKGAGLWGRASQNAMDYRVKDWAISLADLPPLFQEYRILHLSDLHIDAMVDGGEKLRQVLQSLVYDVCVITGDFRHRTYGDSHESLRRIAELVKVIDCPDGIVGVLGNHDFVEMVPRLEQLGIRMLLNEAMSIHRGNEELWMVGVDDPHWYELDDLKKALEPVPPQAYAILLAHSPEVIEEAATRGIGYYLCGHSHGGQICLPGGIPILKNSRCARKFLGGPWEFKGMPGYTSRGTGFSLLSVRFNCRPEVIVHRLERP